MFVSDDGELAYTVIELLCKENGLCATELSDRCSNRGVEVADSTLYRHLGMLVERQILLRYKMRFYVHPLWVERLERCAATLRAAIQRQELVAPLLPKRAGEQRRFKAPSLLQLDSLWNAIVLQIAARVKGEPRFGYNSYGWHSVGMSESEKKLYESAREQQSEIFLLYGSGCAFNEYAAERIMGDGCVVKISPVPHFPDDGYITWVHGSYILECVLPPDLARSLSGAVRSARVEGSATRLVFEAFSRRTATPCVLSVRNSAKRAGALREILQSRLH